MWDGKDLELRLGRGKDGDGPIVNCMTRGGLVE